MSNSYRTDQWYNLGLERPLIGGYTVTDSGYAVPDSDNQDFRYPSRTVRTIDRSGKPTSTPLKRGYIRSLLTDKVSSKKCQFQFNPSSINQSVAQNDTILNFLQADPYQYAQPIPGNVTFNFGLFFDRTMEVANPGPVPARTNDPWARNNPSHIGVLHDLSSLFSLIGVGVTDYMSRTLDNLESSPDDLASGYLSNFIDTFAPSEATADSDDLTATQYKNSLSELVNINKGNSAFLLPLPIRVVFSSLYIVEGLVKDIDIIFTKFSTQMVPIQCRVDISMESKYIGFAKDQTFFTHILAEVESRAVAGPGAFAASSEIDGSNLEAIRADLGKVKLSIVTDNNSDIGYTVSVGSESNAAVPIEVQLATDNPGTKNKKRIKLEFPDAVESTNRLSNMFGSGNSVQVNFQAQVHLYRFIESSIVSEIQQALDARTDGAAGSSTSTAVSTSWGTSNLSNFLSTFGEFINSSRAPQSYTLEQYSEQPDRIYSNGLKLWSCLLDGSNRYSEDDNYGVTTVSTLDEWKAVLDDKVEGAVSTDGAEDRSNIYTVDGQQRRSAETYHDAFTYYIVYQVSMEVTIDGKTSTVTKSVCDKHTPTNIRTDDYYLEKTFNFNW